MLASPKTRCVERHRSRCQILERTERLLRPVQPSRATLRLVRCESGLAVAKDFRDASPLYRLTVGRYLIRREKAAYRRLQGVPGVPRLLPCPDPDTLLLEFIPGTEISRLTPGDLPRSVLAQLRETLDGMHRAGVAHLDLGHDSHGDLGRETNLIWSEDGRLYVVDLAGALLLVPPTPWGRSFFAEVARHDRLALDKVHRRFFPGDPLESPTMLAPWVARLMGALKKL